MLYSQKSAISKKKKMVKAIPEGYHSITPYLIVHDAANAIEFYKHAFEAIERIDILVLTERALLMQN